MNYGIRTPPRVSDLVRGVFTKDPDTGDELEPLAIVGAECGLDHIAMYMKGRDSVWRYRVYVDEWGDSSDVDKLREELEIDRLGKASKTAKKKEEDET